MNKEEAQRRVGFRIAKIRGILGMRQVDLSRRVGVSLTTVVNWELGRYSMSSAYAALVASTFGVGTSDLLDNLDMDENEWTLIMEAKLMRPELRAEVFRQALSEQNRLIDRTRDNLAASFGAREMALV